MSKLLRHCDLHPITGFDLKVVMDAILDEILLTYWTKLPPLDRICPTP